MFPIPCSSPSVPSKGDLGSISAASWGPILSKPLAPHSERGPCLNFPKVAVAMPPLLFPGRIECVMPLPQPPDLYYKYAPLKPAVTKLSGYQDIQLSSGPPGNLRRL